MIKLDKVHERIDVLAWRKMPKIPWRWRNKKTDE